MLLRREAAPKANNAYVTKGMVNHGSVSQYFNDMSQEKFTPQFDIVGSVTVSKNSAYYGGNVGNSTDVRFAGMMAMSVYSIITALSGSFQKRLRAR